MKRLTQFYPFLFAAFPVLFLYSHNVEQVDISEFVAPFAFVLVSTGLLLLVIKKILKSKEKPGIVVSIILLTIFSYGPLFAVFLTAIKVKSASYFTPLYFTFWIAVSFTISYLVITTKKKLDNLAKILSVIAVFLFVIPLISIGTYEAKTNANKKGRLKKEKVSLPTVSGAQTESELPDIYYIILDRYPNKETLKNVYGFDNSEFLDYLASQGFYIANESTANYLKTAHSLASTLNMEYINYLGEELGENYTSWSPLYKKVEDYTVWRYLKSKGYKFIHFGSWWTPTKYNQFADINYNFSFLPEFSSILLQSTVLYPFSVYTEIYNVRYEQFQRVNFKFEKLSEVPKMQEPTFVFAHMLIPHDPYVANEKGEFITFEEEERNEEESYINQLIFTNKKIAEVIEALLETSGDKPIIILQGDEGPFPERYKENVRGFDWKTATEDELKKKVGILNTYYLPGTKKDIFYDSITPVNTFRVVFNQYFDEEFKLLPDKNYAITDEDHPYKFFEVTEKLK